MKDLMKDLNLEELEECNGGWNPWNNAAWRTAATGWSIAGATWGCGCKENIDFFSKGHY